MKKRCGIYELVNSKERKSYKIFASIEDLRIYLNKNKDKNCEPMEPLYIKKEYKEFQNTKVKYLTTKEVEDYLLEQGKVK